MTTVQIVRGRADGTATLARTDTFTGAVWGDPVLPTTAEKNTINSVTFAPGARTYWHHHTGGQILVVTAGRGWVCTHGGTPQVIRVGDVVWVPPGERHWHGGTADTIMTHLAISIGPTVWEHEVSAAEYDGANRTRTGVLVDGRD
ncbi:cupin domain-containing protein [Pseudonocardia xishanensis]|uniref:Cupin type-2 domain-containing protein n=1 Tax=Pseudonocardia xishanensis TaxID=630995 RepID=A0ABP8S029_9PSEU